MAYKDPQRKISYNKDYHTRNREKILLQQKRYRLKNHKKLSIQQKEWREDNKERVMCYKRTFYKINYARGKAKKDEWVQKNRKHVRTSQKLWRTNNKASVNAYIRKKYATDNRFKISVLLRGRFRKALKRRQVNGSAIRDLGCSIAELEIYLQTKFQNGMTWGNHGKWHIDHKVPLYSFDLTDRGQLLRALHYTNLQPLWATDNLKKGRKLSTGSDLTKKQ